MMTKTCPVPFIPRRHIDVELFLRSTEEFAAALISDDLDLAQAIDEKLIALVGTNDRAVWILVDVPPRPMMGYSFNRAIMRLRLGWIEEAVLSMIDTMETLHFSGLHEDIYYWLDMLSQARGKHDLFTSPFQLACDYLLMATLTEWSFPAMSLSFFWKAKSLFGKLGYQDLAEFTLGMIQTQCIYLGECYKTDDPEGTKRFSEYAASLNGVEAMIPPRGVKRKQEWPESPFKDRSGRSQEELQDIYKKFNPHFKTIDEDRKMSGNWPSFLVKKDSLLFKKYGRSRKGDLPNILQLMELLCYDEEKYALRCETNRVIKVIHGSIHDREGTLDQIVDGDHFVFFPRGILNNVYYRGQTIRFTNCRPSLLRDRSERDIFIERVKLCEFSILLHKHPSARLFTNGQWGRLNDGRIESHVMRVDEEALAQHYGILTEYIDVTADKWVAAFFACCDYNRTSSDDRDNYVMHTRNDIGVFYVYQDRSYVKGKDILHPIGLQPFSRPVLQAGYVLRMKPGQNFNRMATGIQFRFDAGCSRILYWLFDQSNKIQPVEMIEKKAKRIVEETGLFSRQAYDLAHSRYFPSLSKREFNALIRKYGLKVQDAPIFDFSPEELEKAKTEFSLQNHHLMRTVTRNQVMEFRVKV